MKAGPERNNLLDLLPQRAKERVFPLLREIELPLGKVLFASGQEVQYVYFPANCIVSLLNVMLDGHSAEISIVGCEGVLGVEVFMGGAAHPARPLSSTPVRPTGCRPPTSRTNSTTMTTCACCCCAIPKP